MYPRAVRRFNADYPAPILLEEHYMLLGVFGGTDGLYGEMLFAYSSQRPTTMLMLLCS